MPFPTPGIFPTQGLNLQWQADSLPSEAPVKTLPAESKGIDTAVKREFVFISLTFQKIERETTN